MKESVISPDTRTSETRWNSQRPSCKAFFLPICKGGTKCKNSTDWKQYSESDFVYAVGSVCNFDTHLANSKALSQMALLCQPVSLSLATRSRKLIYVVISRQYAAACWPSNPPLCMIIHQPRTGAAMLWQISSEKERLSFRCPTPRPLPRFAGSLSNVIESADSKLLTCTFEGKKQSFKMSPIWHRTGVGKWSTLARMLVQMPRGSFSGWS